MKHRVVVTGLGLVTPLGNTVEATFATLPARNATWIMWRTKRARRLWNTRSRTVSALAVRTRHSFSDASRGEQSRSAEFAAEMGSRRGRRQVIDSCCFPPRRNSRVESASAQFQVLGEQLALSPCCTLGTKHSKIILICTVSSPPRSVLRSQPLALGVQKLPLPRHILSRVFRAGYSVTEELPFLFLIANMWVGVVRVQHVLSSHRSFGNLSEA